MQFQITSSHFLSELSARTLQTISYELSLSIACIFRMRYTSATIRQIVAPDSVTPICAGQNDRQATEQQTYLWTRDILLAWRRLLNRHAGRSGSQGVLCHSCSTPCDHCRFRPQNLINSSAGSALTTEKLTALRQSASLR